MKRTKIKIIQLEDTLYTQVLENKFIYIYKDFIELNDIVKVVNRLTKDHKKYKVVKIREYMYNSKVHLEPLEEIEDEVIDEESK